MAIKKQLTPEEYSQDRIKALKEVEVKKAKKLNDKEINKKLVGLKKYMKD